MPFQMPGVLGMWGKEETSGRPKELDGLQQNLIQTVKRVKETTDGSRSIYLNIELVIFD